ncbi:MAG: cation:dicarboxylase symporter family transporter, partial [Gammaproteobacteria bacterium]|nr:cation:dicarboxylase symporter family transporter [Gammaproteobacteria bacterium]
MGMWFEIALWKRILAAIVLGVIVGAIWGPGSESVAWIGTLFIRLIRMVVVPLVFVTLVAGIVSMGDPSKLGSLGVKTLAIYIITTLVAISIGLFLAAVMQPGSDVDLSAAAPGVVQETIPIGETLMGIVPANPIAALAEGDMLAIIFFALLIGVSLLTIGEKGKPVADLMEASTEVMLRITHWVMEVAPFGAFALIATAAG